MSKFSLDFNSLNTQINKKAYKLSEVKDRIEKVAFDVVRFKDPDKASELWQVHSADDGDYIVALYEEDKEENIKTASVKNNWEVEINKISKELHFYYKGEPIVKMASNKLGLPAEEVSMAASYLPKKLSENKKLVNALLNELKPDVKKQVINKFPELV